MHSNFHVGGHVLANKLDHVLGRITAHTLVATLAAALCATAATAQPAPKNTSAPAAAPTVDTLAVSADGSTVVDSRAHLIWSRCVEGMQWDGTTCTGSPTLMERSEAMAVAERRWKAEKLDWRLPRVVELQRLVDKTLQPQGLPPKIFPAAPSQWHWTSTSNVDRGRNNPYSYNNVMRAEGGGGDIGQLKALDGWAVHLGSAEARGDVARSSKLPVRLVRSYVPEAAGR